ncbi:DUF4097 family beta strand repeat-containing protein [Streptomyces mirabilis]|uniref:DUF4097 family beta strand repeat-containing protein n=1 Tax=Streptomyces mirabilis TaxID=68239 RepID=UPI002F9144F3
MPTFTTPEPIKALVNVADGAVRLIAGPRADTVVRVSSDAPDGGTAGESAQGTKVEYADGLLTVRSHERTGLSVTIELPTGSELECSTDEAELTAKGEFGQCRLRTSRGRIELDRTGPLTADLADGILEVARISGTVKVIASSGSVQLGTVEGDVTVKSSTGDIRVAETEGVLELSTADGNIEVGHADGDVNAKASGGFIKVGGLTTGNAHLLTAAGAVEIGISSGVSAWIDARTDSGTVHNELDTRGDPGSTSKRVKVRARTRSGDIVIHRTV